MLALIVQQVAMDGRPFADAIGPAIIAGIVMVVRAAARALSLSVGAAAAAAIKDRVRENLFRQMLAKGPTRLGVPTDDAPRQTAGGDATTLVETVDGLEAFFARFLPQMVTALAVPAGIAIAALYVDWVVAVIFLVTAPLIPLFMILVGLGAESAHRAQMAELARLGGIFLDRLRGLLTLRLLGAADREAERVGQSARDFGQRTMRVLRIAFLSSTVLEFFASVSIALTAIYIGFDLLGIIRFNPPRLTLGEGLFLLLLAPAFYQPLRELATHYHDRAAALAAAATLAPVLDEAAANVVSNGRLPKGPLALDIEGLRFRHGNGAYLFSELTLHLAAGERLALVGPSGTGKTTLLDLVMGFLTPHGGWIHLAGIDMSAVGEAEWRQHIAWLGQRPQLFAGTLRDNIALARPDAPEDAILSAAASAGLAPVLDLLPNGLDTEVGEGGYGLSGGEAQRVAMARAFLKDAPVLILDEPTAHLDLETEASVIRDLDRLAAGRTVVIATHSPAVAALAKTRLDLGGAV